MTRSIFARRGAIAVLVAPALSVMLFAIVAPITLSVWFSLTPYVLAFFGLFWIGHLLGEKPSSKRPKPSEPTPASAV